MDERAYQDRQRGVLAATRKVGAMDRWVRGSVRHGTVLTAVALSLLLGLLGCVAVRTPVLTEESARRASGGSDRSPRVNPSEIGLASWYGEYHHGQPTASGEIFDMTQLTAAHRTLPLGTRLRVMNLENGRVVRVRVNDRGPYVDGRVLDLSQGAAQALGMVERGVVPVRLDVVEGH